VPKCNFVESWKEGFIPEGRILVRHVQSDGKSKELTETSMIEDIVANIINKSSKKLLAKLKFNTWQSTFDYYKNY